MPSRLVVLISGSGSNLQAIIDAIASGRIPDSQIVLVASNRKDAYGLERAQKAKIETAYHNLLPYKKRFPSTDQASRAGSEARKAYDADLAELVLKTSPDLIVCAGWMLILSGAFLDPLAKASVPVINLHPALPGEYDGADALKRAYDDFQAGNIKRTGLMIHYVIQEVDRGEPIITQELELRQGETFYDLETRLHDAEHDLIVQGTTIALNAKRQETTP